MVIGYFLNVLRTNEENLYFSMRNSAVWKENFPESNQTSQHQTCLPDSKSDVREGTSTLQISRPPFGALLLQWKLLSTTGNRVAVREKAAGERSAARSWPRGGGHEGEGYWGCKEGNLFLKHASSFPLFAQRIHLDIRVGEHDLDAAIAQAKDKVNEVSFKLEHLIEQIEQVVKEQNYQRVSLPIQLIFYLPARNIILHTRPLNQGQKNLPVLWSLSLSHTMWTGRVKDKSGPLDQELLQEGRGSLTVGVWASEWTNEGFQTQLKYEDTQNAHLLNHDSVPVAFCFLGHCTQWTPVRRGL